MTNTRMIRYMMFFLVLLYIFVSPFLWPPLVFSQEYRIFDYFSTETNPEAKAYIKSVDTYHTNKVMNWIHNKNYDAALSDLQFALKRFPNHPKALMLIVTYAHFTNSPNMAMPYYERAIKLFPQHAITYAQYGTYLVDIGIVQIGIERLKKAIEINPKLSIAYKWLSEAYIKKGDIELARKTIEKAKELGLNVQDSSK